MEENKNYQTEEENLPKPKSMKAHNKKYWILVALMVLLWVLGKISGRYGIFFYAIEIPLAVALIILNLKNRAK